LLTFNFWIHFLSIMKAILILNHLKCYKITDSIITIILFVAFICNILHFFGGDKKILPLWHLLMHLYDSYRLCSDNCLFIKSNNSSNTQSYDNFLGNLLIVLWSGTSPNKLTPKNFITDKRSFIPNFAWGHSVFHNTVTKVF